VILALLLAAAAPQTAVDAERAFADMAQTEGQWTAFRAFAAPDAIMFVPEAGNAQAWLKDKSDPPQSVMWWPGRSWVSCDGSLAVNTGPWVRAGGTSSGTFTTVWKRQGDGGWKWLLDHGRTTPRPVPIGDVVKVARPVCRNLAGASSEPLASRPAGELFVQTDDAMPGSSIPAYAAEEGPVLASGRSADGSLRWETRSLAGEAGAHVMRVWTWAGSEHRLALFELSGVKPE
jgi:hypothetical protein